MGPQGPPSFCPGHLRACPHAHIVSPSPWGSQTFLGLLWGSPRRASIIVWQMRGEANFLLSPLSSPPSAQGQTPQDPLQAPNQVRKHGRGPPGVPRRCLKPDPQAPSPGRAGRLALTQRRAGSTGCWSHNSRPRICAGSAGRRRRSSRRLGYWHQL